MEKIIKALYNSKDNEKYLQIEVVIDNDDHRFLLHNFYETIFIDAFPDENERERESNMLKQLERFNAINGVSYYIILLVKNNTPIAGIIADYFDDCNSVAIEYILVSKEFRRQNLSKYLINGLLEKIADDYAEGSVKHIFFETENPNKVAKKFISESLNRLQYWQANNAMKIDIDYLQPPLEEDKLSVKHLYLAYLKMSKGIEYLERDLLKKFLFDFFTLAFDLDDDIANKYIDKNIGENIVFKLVNLIDKEQ